MSVINNITTTLVSAQPVSVEVLHNFVSINGKPIPADAILAFASFYKDNQFDNFNFGKNKHDYKQLMGFLWQLEDIQAEE